jgi:hypothetical protein
VSYLVATDRPPGFADDLRSLETARAEGAITQAEFEQTKASILARLQQES